MYLELQNIRPFFNRKKNHFSGIILHYLCIFNGKFRKNLAFMLQFVVRVRRPRPPAVPTPVNMYTKVRPKIRWKLLCGSVPTHIPRSRYMKTAQLPESSIQFPRITTLLTALLSQMADTVALRILQSRTSSCRRIGHFSRGNHHFSGAILHSFCIFDMKLREKLAFILQLPRCRWHSP